MHMHFLLFVSLWQSWPTDTNISHSHAATCLPWGVGTSPLYVYASIFPEAAPSKEDVIGALSLILYTITISLVFKSVASSLVWGDGGGM